MKINNTNKFGWAKYSQHILQKDANCFWQKRLYFDKNSDEDIYADIIEHTMMKKKSYQIDIQIPEELSITKITINIILFHYNKLDFDKMEKDALKVIKNLIK